MLYLVLAIITAGFLADLVLDLLNKGYLAKGLPEVLSSHVDPERFLKSRSYLASSMNVGIFSAVVSFVILFLMFSLGGFSAIDQWIKGISSNDLFTPILFFGVLMAGFAVISLPFEIWSTFVIEEKFGFNRTTAKTFILDKIKSILLICIIGIPLVMLVIWIYMHTGNYFWILVWTVLSVFSLFFSLFYSTLIVPLFNKQVRLEEGPLRSAIENLAARDHFPVEQIFVIDGSKRSAKSNAYFTGFGRKKRIVLYDTLIKDLETNEILAVLAHEMGHYRLRHIIAGMILSILQTGLILFIFSLVVNNQVLATAAGVQEPSFHIGVLVFGVLFSPVTSLLGLFFNKMSRHFEYQADAYAGRLGYASDLSSALIKLGDKNFSNLTPHPAYVFVHYSHPPLVQRLKALESFKHES
jgi:STE24 endopeptidase